MKLEDDATATGDADDVPPAKPSTQSGERNGKIFELNLPDRLPRYVRPPKPASRRCGSISSHSSGRAR